MKFFVEQITYLLRYQFHCTFKQDIKSFNCHHIKQLIPIIVRDLHSKRNEVLSINHNTIDQFYNRTPNLDKTLNRILKKFTQY